MTVFVPFAILITWDNCPSSYAKDISQNFLSGSFTRCLSSWATPDILWVTALDSWTFWNCDVNEKRGIGFFLPLDIKLDLGTSMSTVVGCVVCTLGGSTGTSGRIMFGSEGDMWTLCWKLVEHFPSSSSMVLGCTEGRCLFMSGRTFWGTMEDFSLVSFVEGLLFAEN